MLKNVHVFTVVKSLECVQIKKAKDFLHFIFWVGLIMTYQMVLSIC